LKQATGCLGPSCRIAQNADQDSRRIQSDRIGPRRAQAFNSDLFDIAIKLVRLADETAKPNAERLREYSEAGLDSLKLQLFSDAPIYDDLETCSSPIRWALMLRAWARE